jgi:hypothetical protein
MDFFQKHDKALRKGRLLQAAAILMATDLSMKYSKAVDMTFILESLIEDRLEKEENEK